MIAEILLSLIDPNPFRDFDLHPIDDMQVARLVASIGADGFWASVVARQVGKRFQIAFGHHRIEAARRAGMNGVHIDVRDLSDLHMARMLATENATQRGTTAAASLDAIAALSRVVVEQCCKGDAASTAIIIAVSQDAAERIHGSVLTGDGPGERCILEVMPDGAFTRVQVRLALGVLKDSGRMAGIIAAARGDNVPADVAPVFDANCAKLFKLDYHLEEFRRIVTGDVVRSYLPVEQQAAFAQRVIAKAGTASELTAIKLRENANAIFYDELGMPRSAMRASNKRATDDRIKDALNLLRRGAHGVRVGCDMLRTILDDGTVLPAMAHDRMQDFIEQIEAAVTSVRSQPRSRLRVIRGREERMSEQQDVLQNGTNSIDLACRFYDDHKQQFEEAATKNELSDQYFDMVMADFDRWLVSQGVLEDPAERFDSNSAQRYGVVSLRNAARARLNRAARKATDHPAYSISTRSAGNGLRIKLVELYTRDAPADIAGGFRTSTTHYLRQVRRNVKLANSSSAVSDLVRQKVNLCASVMEPLLNAFAWAAMNMQTEIKQQEEGRAMGLPSPNKPRRLK